MRNFKALIPGTRVSCFHYFNATVPQETVLLLLLRTGGCALHLAVGRGGPHDEPDAHRLELKGRAPRRHVHGRSPPEGEAPVYRI
jgi:hypothetical protein